MNNQKKWNKELLYSIIFLITAGVMLFADPFFQLEKLIYSNTNTVYNLLSLKILPILDYTIFSSDIFFYLTLMFLALSVYVGFKSLKRIPTNKKRIFDLVPLNIPGLLAFVFTCISLFFLIIFILGVTLL